MDPSYAEFDDDLSPLSQFLAAVNDTDNTSPPDRNPSLAYVDSQSYVNNLNQNGLTCEGSPPTSNGSQYGNPSLYQPYEEVCGMQKENTYMTQSAPVANPAASSQYNPSPQVTPYSTPTPAASPAPSITPVHNSEPKKHAPHTKVTDIADPYTCSICFHQCVRKESIRKHMIDHHHVKRENCPQVKSRSELIKAGIDPSKVNTGFKAPAKLHKRKHELSPIPALDERVQTASTTMTGVTNSMQISVSAAEAAKSHHFHPQARDWNDTEEVDAYLSALRNRGEPYSSEILTQIARHALLRLPEEDRKALLRQGGETWTIPAPMVQRAVRDAFAYRREMEAQAIGDLRGISGITEHECKRVRMSLGFADVGSGDLVDDAVINAECLKILQGTGEKCGDASNA